MAKQLGVYKFTGRIDNVIGYRRKGVYCVRTMPETVRQTAATRRAARSFGMASRKGKLIRRALCAYIDTCHDGSYVNRLNKELVQAGSHNLQALQGFRFNKHTPLGNLFLLPPTLTPDGKVHIPAQELMELDFGKATCLEVTVIAARVNFSERRVVNANAVAEMIDLSIPFNGLTFDVPASGKGSLILAIQARACDECNGKIAPIGGRRYMAADIISIIPPYELIEKVSRKKASGKRSRSRGLIPVITVQPEEGSSASVIARPAGPNGEPGRSSLPGAFNKLE